jgi:hypothetical protein
VVAGAVLAEAALRRVIEVEHGRVRRGPASAPSDGALAGLAARVDAEGRPRKVDDWLHAGEAWALQAVVTELEEAGIARFARTRALGVIPTGGLELLDPEAQRLAAESARTAVDPGGRPTPESVLLSLVLAATGDLRHHVPGTSTRWAPWSSRVPRPVRRRLRLLRAELAPAPREVAAGFERYCKRRRREYVA